MGFPIAEQRLFKDVWICQRCNSKIRGSASKRPDKCRKCGSTRLRLKKKTKK